MRRAVSTPSRVPNGKDQRSGSPHLLLRKQCLSVESVPEQFKERFLTRGYRQPYSTFLESLTSIFTLTNETFNVWTHLIPLIFLLVYFLKTFPSELWPPTKINPWYYPLLGEEIAVIAYHCGSVVAHIFNCMTPRIRHMCFFLDYAAIAMFAQGAACASIYYLRPLNSYIPLINAPSQYVGLLSLLNLLGMYLCCASRHKWQHSKYLIRTLSVLPAFIAANVPTAYYRILTCVFTSEECDKSIIFLLIASFAYLIAAIINSTRFPESCYPCTFDICGHSHQLMHSFTSLGTFGHIVAVQIAIRERADKLPTLLEEVSFFSSLGWVIGMLIVSVCLALWFGSRLTQDGYLRKSYLRKTAASG